LLFIAIYNQPVIKFRHLRWIVIWILSTLLAGCLIPQADALPVPLFTPTVASTATQTLVPPTLTLTPTFTAIPTQTATQTPEPAGCQKPPEDYTRVEVNGSTINQRTLAMLTHAQELYSGELQIIGPAITQGSYTDVLAASFGTHAGGGAVDLSVLREGTYTVLWDDLEPLIRALRAAGFAAWVREYGELYADSPIHIHAIAIGDQELSPAAQEQLTGEAGYFSGYNGLPVAMYGAPTPDRYGGPILCQWMIDMGYQDLR
jgi:hypothetical protein